MALKDVIEAPDYIETTVDATILPLSVTDLTVDPPTWQRRGRIRIRVTRTVKTWVSCTYDAAKEYIDTYASGGTKKWTGSFELTLRDAVLKAYDLQLTESLEEREYTDTNAD